MFYKYIVRVYNNNYSDRDDLKELFQNKKNNNNFFSHKNKLYTVNEVIVNLSNDQVPGD